jgi:hypothetical protein
MRRASFFLGLILLLFPLNWARLALMGAIPDGTPPIAVAWVGAGVLIVSVLLIRAGIPSARSIPADVASAGQKIASQIRTARERAAEQRLVEENRRETALDVAHHGTLEAINPGTVVLQQNENAYASVVAAIIEERTVQTKGRSKGISVRVAKGVWIRSGASKAVSERRLVPVARGSLVATNRRLVFAGDKKSIAVPLSKITSFEPLKDGLRVGDGTKSYSFMMTPSEQQRLFMIIAHRMVHEARLQRL